MWVAFCFGSVDAQGLVLRLRYAGKIEGWGWCTGWGILGWGGAVYRGMQGLYWNNRMETTI